MGNKCLLISIVLRRENLIMEYILQETDIFDEDIATKFSDVIKTNQNKFIKGKSYNLTVSFHVNLLNDSRF